MSNVPKLEPMELKFKDPTGQQVECHFRDGVEAHVALPSIEGEIEFKTGERRRFLEDVELALEDPTHQIITNVMFNRLPKIVMDLKRRGERFSRVTQAVHRAEPINYDPTRRVPGHRVEAQLMAGMQEEFTVFHGQHVTKLKHLLPSLMAERHSQN